MQHFKRRLYLYLHSNEFDMFKRLIRYLLTYKAVSTIKKNTYSVRIIAAFSLLCIVLQGCDPCRGQRSCADVFSFRIVDKVTRQDLVFGPGSIYKTDSVYLTTKLPDYSGAMSSFDSIMKKFTSRLLIPVDTFFLNITSADTDTVIVNYQYVNSKCCIYSEKGYGQVRGIQFNGVNTTQEGDIFIFTK